LPLRHGLISRWRGGRIEIGDAEGSEHRGVLDMRPIHHHTDDRVQAHIFVPALPFTIHRAIEKKLKAAGLDLCATQALIALKTVRVVDIDLGGRATKRWVIRSCVRGQVMKDTPLPWHRLYKDVHLSDPSMRSANQMKRSTRQPSRSCRNVTAFGGLLTRHSIDFVGIRLVRRPRTPAARCRELRASGLPTFIATDLRTQSIFRTSVWPRSR
jgi:hypothetical protein